MTTKIEMCCQASLCGLSLSGLSRAPRGPGDRPNKGGLASGWRPTFCHQRVVDACRGQEETGPAEGPLPALQPAPPMAGIPSSGPLDQVRVL